MVLLQSSKEVFVLSVCVYGNDIISMELGGIVGISIIQFNMQNMKWSGFWRKVINKSSQKNNN